MARKKPSVQQKIRAMLQDIATFGYSKRPPIAIGRLAKSVTDFARDRMIYLESDVIYYRQDKLYHAIRDSKQEKGIAVSPKDLVDFPVKKKTMAKYYDEDKGDFIYVDTNAKYVLTPNFKIRLSSGKERVVVCVTATKLEDHSEFNKKNLIKISDN